MDRPTETTSTPRSTRRTTPAGLTAALTAVLALALGACGAAESSGSATGGSSQTPSASSTAAAGTFPATIDTAYGKVTVEEDPQRIVVLSATYLELLPLLDETPTHSAEDAASLESWAPWLEGADLGTVDPGLLGADWAPSPEAIAAHQPDLILTDIWNTDEKLYEQLSQIAPTYVGIETDTQSTWQQHLSALASLTGHDPSIVDDVQTELTADFDAAAAELPGLQDASYVIPVYKDDQFWPSEYGNDPILALGLTPSEQQPHDGVTAAEVDTISLENIDLLTEDVVFVAASGAESSETIAATYAALQADPRVAASPATGNGTWVYLDGPQWSAINGGSPLSHRWWLTQVLPQLEGSALNRSGQ